MKYNISEETKRRERRGTGEGASYIPYIKPRELPSTGTSVHYIDPKHGRQMNFPSHAELWWYLKLRWDDNVKDIREQYPLDIEKTMKAAKDLDFIHPQMNGIPLTMTTDMLVTYEDDHLEAYSVKTDTSVLDEDDKVQHLRIEKSYWNGLGIKFHLVYKTELDRIEIMNIKNVFKLYNPSNVRTKIDYIKYLIAHKVLQVNMHEPIDYYTLSRDLLDHNGNLIPHKEDI